MRAAEDAGRQPDRRARARSDAPATYAIIGACVLAFVAEIAGGGDQRRRRAATAESACSTAGRLRAPFVADGEPYRLVTSAFLHAGIIHLGLNMFALYILGTLLEPAIGTARFVGIYASPSSAARSAHWSSTRIELTVGASGGIFGLMARRLPDRPPPRPRRARVADRLLRRSSTWSSPSACRTISVGGHIGGLIGGRDRGASCSTSSSAAAVPNAQTLEIVGLVALCAVAVVGALVAADRRSQPGSILSSARRSTSSRRSATERRITPWLRRRAMRPGTERRGRSRAGRWRCVPPSSGSSRYSPSTSLTPSPSTNSHQMRSPRHALVVVAQRVGDPLQLRVDLEADDLAEAVGVARRAPRPPRPPPATSGKLS